MSQNHDYTDAGFSPFMTRSIDETGASNLDGESQVSQLGSREMNYDQSPTTGNLGSVIQIGNIKIDGVTGRISIYDDNGNEVTRIGAL